VAIKYMEFKGSCDGERVGSGTSYEGYLQDDKKGAEKALASLNAWKEAQARNIVAINFGFEKNTMRDNPDFVVRILYED
jgi:hypothetical protein